MQHLSASAAQRAFRLFSRPRKTHIVWLLFFLLAPFSMTASAKRSVPPSSNEVLVLTVNGSINPGTADYIQSGITAANQRKAAMVLLELDTPGGLLQATRSIVKAILNSKVPVAVFVTPSGARAGSAGVFITMAGHIAAMSPGTNIGAAHPVVGGKDPEKTGGKHMARKIENDTLAFIEAIAKQRGRNVAWGKKAVLKSDSITSDKARKLKVIDLIAKNRRDLLNKLNGFVLYKSKKKLDTSNWRLVEHEMSLKQKLVNIFANPSLAYFLLLLGMFGIFGEFKAPGSIFPGVLGSICLLLFFVTSQILPINYGGMALIFLGLLLFIAEIFTPTFGALLVGGVISMTVGSIFLINDPTFQLPLSTILPTVGVFGGLAGVIVFSAMSSQAQPIVSSQNQMVGMEAIVRKPLNPVGTVRLMGEVWTAKLKGEGSLEEGATVRITAMEGLTLEVEAVTKS